MQKLLPVIRSVAGDVFVFQQDNAPAHRARDTVELLRRKTPQLISPDMWPANTPDLNPVDCRICGMLQERVYRVPIHDTDELRKRLVATWAEFQQSVVDDAVDQWRKRLEACIRVSSFVETKKYSPGTTPSPEIFARTDLPSPDSSES